MELTYKNIKEISQERLVDLFKSVEWESANYPAQLVQAIKNYGSVFSAWDNDKCVGLVASMDDSIMVAYVHYKDYHKVCLIGVNTAVGFYEHLGFEVNEKAKPMFYLNKNY